jgi:hypothetical protein
MMSIHTTTNAHVGPLSSGPVPTKYLSSLHQALQILKHRVRTDAGCNASFQRLSNRNDFQYFIDTPYIWINYDPSNDGGLCGWTQPRAHPMDIVITQFSLRMGAWADG